MYEVVEPPTTQRSHSRLRGTVSPIAGGSQSHVLHHHRHAQRLIEETALAGCMIGHRPDAVRLIVYPSVIVCFALQLGQHVRSHITAYEVILHYPTGYRYLDHTRSLTHSVAHITYHLCFKLGYVDSAGINYFSRGVVGHS